MCPDSNRFLLLLQLPAMNKQTLLEILKGDGLYSGDIHFQHHLNLSSL